MSLTNSATFFPGAVELKLPHPKRVLVVDDDEDLREIFTAVLEMNGFEVETASNVSEALKLICAREFDVLLSDLQMPGDGDGLTVVGAMRHFNPRALTFILSGHPEMDKAAKAIIRQLDVVLTKPISPELLVRAIIDRLMLAAHSLQEYTQASSLPDSTRR